MLLMIGIQVLLQLLGMALQVMMWAAAAYYVAKYGRKGWRAGK